MERKPFEHALAPIHQKGPHTNSSIVEIVASFMHVVPTQPNRQDR
jgi:hypothetical protein